MVFQEAQKCDCLAPDLKLPQLSLKAVKVWNRLPRCAVESDSLEIFKIQMDKYLKKLIEEELM